MTQFLQLHLLTAYPPANLNRDDTGRPKTATVGGSERLRISSQALKRAWRTSVSFQNAMTGYLGQRSQRFLKEMVDTLVTHHGLAPEEALKRVQDALNPETAKKGDKKAKKNDDAKATKVFFGSLQTKEGRGDLTNEMVHLGPEEQATLDRIVEKLAAGETVTEANPLVEKPLAVDIALFGRMLAGAPEYNVEASVQVAHAFTTHQCAVEDDYFTAVDDLKHHEDDRGAGHVNVQEFGAGLFYLYVCLDVDHLLANLKGDRDLTARALAALIESAATVAPGGKQNSFASRAYTHYLLAERGTHQPRTLAAAFMDRVSAVGVMPSVEKLETLRHCFDTAYAMPAEAAAIMNVAQGTGTLAEVQALAQAAVAAAGEAGHG